MANQNEKILVELLNIEENDRCCDCGSRGLLSKFLFVFLAGILLRFIKISFSSSILCCIIYLC